MRTIYEDVVMTNPRKYEYFVEAFERMIQVNGKYLNLKVPADSFILWCKSKNYQNDSFSLYVENTSYFSAFQKFYGFHSHQEFADVFVSNKEREDFLSFANEMAYA